VGMRVIDINFQMQWIPFQKVYIGERVCSAQCLAPHDVKTSTAFFLHIQGVPGGKDLTSGECSLGQTIPI
jgi:hypothetical protein